MDISRQTFSEANSTGVSMYLSFDSSISSTAYKTLEATTCELSMLSNMDHDEATVENSEEILQNSTLEALDSHLSYLESVKDKDIDSCSLLSAVPKRILQEYNVVSSTPTKEQLLRSVEVARGSSADRCVDLSFAFMEVDDKKVNATDKENAVPLKEATMLSNKNVEALLPAIIEEKSSVIDETNSCKHEEEQNIDEETTPKTISKVSTNDKELQDTESKQSKVADINKRKSIAKKPICEPDLLANRPSRIAINSKNRYSINNFGTRANIDQDIQEIPKLMNKVLKFAEVTTTVTDKTKTSSLPDTRKSISYNSKGRSSMLPSSVASQGEKRPFAFTQRMSVLVKTTLNSPARKIARRSALPNAQQSRKSTVPTGLPSNSRKSMLPIGRTVQTNSIDANTNTESSKYVPANRKSIYAVEKSCNDIVKNCNIPPVSTSNSKVLPNASRKPENTFVCKVCGCKFSLKSLLEAHKRSHEGDGMPAFVKKTTSNISSTTSSITQSNNGNKCKYCDKKFVLVRALHIHLLQNCPKIPPGDKRKLKFHEMDHVEKAQLPTFFHANTSAAKLNSQTQNTSTNAPQQRTHSDLSSISVSSTDSTNDKKAFAEITIIANTAAAAVEGLLPEMAPPAARMVKKSTAHAGVHRTPNKAIICHICKMSFKCIMDHIQHNMTVHFKNTETPKSNVSNP